MAAALRKVYDALLDSTARLINVVHDEIVVECGEEDVVCISQQMESGMVAAFTELFPEHPDLAEGLVEVGVGNNWADAK